MRCDPLNWIGFSLTLISISAPLAFGNLQLFNPALPIWALTPLMAINAAGFWLLGWAAKSKAALLHNQEKG